LTDRAIRRLRGGMTFRDSPGQGACSSRMVVVRGGGGAYGSHTEGPVFPPWWEARLQAGRVGDRTRLEGRRLQRALAVAMVWSFARSGRGFIPEPASGKAGVTNCQPGNSPARAGDPRAVSRDCGAGLADPIRPIGWPPCAGATLRVRCSFEGLLPGPPGRGTRPHSAPCRSGAGWA